TLTYDFSIGDTAVALFLSSSRPCVRSDRAGYIISGRDVAPFGGTDMRSLVVTAVALALLPVSAKLRADEKSDALEKQRKAAKDSRERGEAGAVVLHETSHLIVLAPPALEKRLKDIGVLLEKHYDTAAKALFTPKDTVWPGKLAVYLFAEPVQLDSFIRR